jgi:type I pantothenate kinase
MTLRATSFQDPNAYFHRFAQLSEAEAEEQGRRIWKEINLLNLQENILPTRERATLILYKNLDHSVREVWLRRR